MLTSNGGALLLGLADRATGLLRRLAGCFKDLRDPRYTRHGVESMVGQRVLGLALGYEDLNDHDALREDPVLRAVLGRLDGPLAGKSTLNRMELGAAGADRERHRRVKADFGGLDALLVDLFLERHGSGRRRRSCWTWTRRTRRCTAVRRAGSSTGTTASTATCR